MDEQEARRGTILVIDDDPSVRRVVGLMLGELGYAAIAAADGAEGVEQLRAHRGIVSAVLLDVSLPRLTTPEVLGRLRDVAAEVPVLLTSGLTEEYCALPPGQPALAFIQKPFFSAELQQKLAEVLQAPR